MWQIWPECSILIWKVFHRRRCPTWKLPAHPATAAPMLSPDLSTDGNLPRRTRLLSSLLSTSSPTQILRPHYYASALTNALSSQLYNSYFYITAPRRPTNVRPSIRPSPIPPLHAQASSKASFSDSTSTFPPSLAASSQTPPSKDSNTSSQAELQWMMDPDYLAAVDVAECGRLSLA